MQGHNSSGYGQNYDSNWQGSSSQPDNFAGQFDIWRPTVDHSSQPSFVTSNYPYSNNANEDSWKISRDNAINEARRSVNMPANRSQPGTNTDLRQSSQYSLSSHAGPTISQPAASSSNQYYGSSNSLPPSMAQPPFHLSQQYQPQQQPPPLAQQQYQPQQPYQSHIPQQQYIQQSFQQQQAAMQPQHNLQQPVRQQFQQTNFTNYVSNSLSSSSRQSPTLYDMSNNSVQTDANSASWSTASPVPNTNFSQKYSENSSVQWNSNTYYSNDESVIYKNPLDDNVGEDGANSAGE